MALQLVKYDVHTTRKIKFIHAIILSHIIILCKMLQACIEAVR